LRILRIIDSFQLTTVSSSDDLSLKKETLGQVQITRVPVQFALGQYKVSFGMMTYLRQYHILHSHMYRTFQTDCAFFLR
jgi:hypothetical protein